jgi:HAE1 family hydrophobic/amphiphilic exporter-1
VRRLRVLLAVAISIPLSLLIALMFFDVLGVSFNMISLSGLALGVGMLVDNAIVVVENITRLRQTGLSLREAGRQGTQEVASAITSSTLTTVAVFLPITFVEGLAGRLFRDQSLAVVCSLAASLLVALTVVPLVAAWSRKRKHAAAEIESDSTEASYVTEAPALTGETTSASPVLALYERGLEWCLDHRGTVAVTASVMLAVSLFVGFALPREVVPETEQGRVQLHLTMPSDADLPLVSVRSATIERQAAAQPEVEHVLADLGERDEARLELEPRPPYEADITLIVKPGHPSRPVATALLEQLDLDRAIDLSVEVRPVQTQLEALLTRGEGDLYIDLVAEDRRDAESVVDVLLTRLQSESALRNVHRFDFERVPAYRVSFKRDEMARQGVPTSIITAKLEAAGRGREATALRSINESVPIVLRSQAFESVEALLRERIQTRTGLLPLGAFVEVTEVDLPSDLVRIDQSSIIRVVADIAPGAELRRASRAVNNALADILPANVRGTLRGATDAFNEGLRALGISLLLSILLVYLILAAQFESLIQPLVIMIAVPLAAAGVVLTLWLTGQSLNLMSLTGCVVLVGIVVNDAILKVDFINQRRAAGLALREALMKAGRDRARPIVMTTVTTVLGLTPMALGLGAGSALQAPLAIAIIGGLASSTLLTMFVVPVCYDLIVGRKGRPALR